MKINQENIDMIQKVKLVKAMNEDIYFKDFADYLEMNVNSFYNWLNGAYNLSSDKIQKLRDIVLDFLD